MPTRGEPGQLPPTDHCPNCRRLMPHTSRRTRIDGPYHDAVTIDELICGACHFHYLVTRYTPPPRAAGKPRRYP